MTHPSRAVTTARRTNSGKPSRPQWTTSCSATSPSILSRRSEHRWHLEGPPGQPELPRHRNQSTRASSSMTPRWALPPLRYQPSDQDRSARNRPRTESVPVDLGHRSSFDPMVQIMNPAEPFLTNKNTPRGQPLGLNRNRIRNKTENP
jgi:hypothetical protein